MVKIDRSRFGKGLFATRQIRKGTIITRLRKGNPFHFQDTLEMGNRESHSLQIGPEEYIMCPTPFLYSNHSCDPNGGLNMNLEMIALRDIMPGEEICWDYSTSMLERSWEMICHCGSSLCRGIVRDFDLLPIYVQSRYLQMQIVLPFIQDVLFKKAWPLTA
ncbi:MAG TPA: SET domain-containing protein [Chitinophagaceae bacterium]|nr:SET domain-containing protein [Chitinophagaceae bacterium]